MNRLFVIAGALAVAATMLPLGTATWYNAGSYEPDTVQDAQGGFMHADPDVSPTGRNVYFNAYPTAYLTSTNPNSGTVGSRVVNPGERYWMAMLGEWKDCNGDNYVGIQESAMWSYPASLLTESAICPAGGAHNDGQWVHELLPIGPVPDDSFASYVVNDTEAAVWADFGLPGAGPAGSCPIYPLPHGTTSGTGAVLRYADCFLVKRGTGTVNELDPNGDLGIGFEDANNPQQSDSLLNQHLPVNLFGNPTTCEPGVMQKDGDECGTEPTPAFTTYDCDNTAEINPTGDIVVPDPTGGEIFTDGQLVISPAFVPPSPSTSVNPTGSYAKALNNTVGGAEGCGSGNDYSDAHDTAQFFLDQANEGSLQVVEKNQAEFGFTFFESAGPISTGEICLDDSTCTPDVGQNTLFGETSPNGLGINAARGLFDGAWSADTVYATTPQLISRATLGPSPRQFTTIYAKIGAQSNAEGLFGLSSGVYGSEICGSDFTTDANPGDGWMCDASKWNIDGNGDVTSTNPVVGTPYQFRDIDCHDGSVAKGAGVQASLVALEPQGPCDEVA